MDTVLQKHLGRKAIPEEEKKKGYKVYLTQKQQDEIDHYGVGGSFSERCAYLLLHEINRQKEEEAKELTVQVEAPEIVVTALLRHMEHDAQQALIQDIEQAIDQVTPCPPVNDHDAMLLQQYLKKLLRHPRS